jgi:hypothetical protein
VRLTGYPLSRAQKSLNVSSIKPEKVGYLPILKGYMRHFIPTLSIAFVLSSCATNPEILNYQSVVQDTEETGFTMPIVRAAPTVINEIGNTPQVNTKLLSEGYSYLGKAAKKPLTLVTQRLDDCFIGLTPDYCWYADLAENNTRTIEELSFGYLKKATQELEEPCATSIESCASFNIQEITFINSPKNESPSQLDKNTNARARVVLDFVSLTVNF